MHARKSIMVADSPLDRHYTQGYDLMTFPKHTCVPVRFNLSAERDSAFLFIRFPQDWILFSGRTLFSAMILFGERQAASGGILFLPGGSPDSVLSTV